MHTEIREKTGKQTNSPPVRTFSEAQSSIFVISVHIQTHNHVAKINIWPLYIRLFLHWFFCFLYCICNSQKWMHSNKYPPKYSVKSSFCLFLHRTHLKRSELHQSAAKGKYKYLYFKKLKENGYRGKCRDDSKTVKKIFFLILSHQMSSTYSTRTKNPTWMGMLWEIYIF